MYLAGCKNLLVVAGPTYTERLWCVIEIFTYLYMTLGDLSEVIFLPITDKEDDDDLAQRYSASANKPTWGSIRGFMGENTELRKTLEPFKEFDVNKAKCFKPEDRHALLGVIESGMGTLDSFNQFVQDTFAKLLSEPSSAKHASTRRESRRPSRLASSFLALARSNLGSTSSRCGSIAPAASDDALSADRGVRAAAAGESPLTA